jgi:hypothetical protein
MIRIHHCAGQIDVAEERKEPPAPACRCRKFITLDKATQMVKKGEASWVVTKRTRGYAEVTCSLCGGNKEIKNCANCAGKGVAIESVVWNKYNNDVVLVSELPEDEKEKKRSSVLKKKTPRTATIESKHIERAYSGALTEKKPRQWIGKEGVEARERIEEYGMLVLENRAFIGKDKIYVIGVEPENDPKIGQGRDYDYGRTI